ncbi:MAG: hypothetical protein KVP17_003327 [Porospora cf. gigantea B]|uniref:uncharacterized protein n=1 Tax=Porospora cf. gigantea B TaxID=2853592 RepID=UPI0035718C9F|nr:MAG: hypothetical protein KVP17_003327 [Porospora cf. gigantea B]
MNHQCAIFAAAVLLLWIAGFVYIFAVRDVRPLADSFGLPPHVVAQVRGADKPVLVRQDSYQSNRLLDAKMTVELPTGPLKWPSQRMKHLKDDITNYKNARPGRYHGDIGKRPDGKAHAWESTLDVSLDREFPDFRNPGCGQAPYFEVAAWNNLPSASVVIIFANEPWETLMRSVHSVLNRSPPHMLMEIILVDDGSTHEDLSENGNGRLENYIKLLPKVKLVRTRERAGITRARTAGINATSSDIFVILDSHIECQDGWLEPLVHRIQQQPNTVVMPQIDNIRKTKEWTPVRGGVGCTLGLIWKLMEHHLNAVDQVSPADRFPVNAWDYISSPSMAGGLFAAHKQVFLGLGGYDLDMRGWGAENVEFSFRLWQCGARLECNECSRVSHVFGRGKFYSDNGGNAVSNRIRTAAAWMDDFGVLPWLINGKPDAVSVVHDMKEMKTVRDVLQCKDFKWFIQNVFPESEVHGVPDDVPYAGKFTHIESGSGFNRPLRGTAAETGAGGNLLYFARDHRLTHIRDDETCLHATNEWQFQWNWCWRNDRNTAFTVELQKDGIDHDEVFIRADKHQKCLTVEQGKLALVQCAPGDRSLLWSAPKLDVDEYRSAMAAVF